MRLVRLEILQWFGLLAGFGAWVGDHVVGSGLTQALCNPGGAHWGISNDTWQIGLLVACSVVILAAESAAIAVFLATREQAGEKFSGAPPPGRMHFFAAAAIVANVLFLMMVILNSVGAIAGLECVQS
jgi:hypothetical protein